MSQKSSSHLGIADIICVAALAILGVLSFFGVLIKNDSMGVAAIIAVVLVILLGALVFGARWAKRIDHDFSRFLFVEIALVVVYFIVALIGSQAFVPFFGLLSNKSEIADAAYAESNYVGKMIATYNQNADNMLGEMSSMIDNYISIQPHNPSASMNEYIYGKNKEDAHYSNAAAWISQGLDIVCVDSTTITNRKALFDKATAVNPLTIGPAAKELSELAANIKSDLIKKYQEVNSVNHYIPYITRIGSNYSWNGYIDICEFGDLTPPSPTTTEVVKAAASAKSVSGWIVYIIIIIVALLPWIVAVRSGKMGPVGGNSPGADL